MTPSPEQLRLCAYLMENPEVPWEVNHNETLEWFTYRGPSPWDVLRQRNTIIRIKLDFNSPTAPKYSREGKRLLILHNQDCDQFGDITGESPSHLWFTRHGGYFKMEKATGEVETLKPSEF